MNALLKFLHVDMDDKGVSLDKKMDMYNEAVQCFMEGCPAKSGFDDDISPVISADEWANMPNQIRNEMTVMILKVRKESLEKMQIQRLIRASGAKPPGGIGGLLAGMMGGKSKTGNEETPQGFAEFLDSFTKGEGCGDPNCPNCGGHPDIGLSSVEPLD